MTAQRELEDVLQEAAELKVDVSVPDDTKKALEEAEETCVRWEGKCKAKEEYAACLDGGEGINNEATRLFDNDASPTCEAEGGEGTDTHGETDGKACTCEVARVPHDEGDAGFIPICTRVCVQHGGHDSCTMQGKQIDSRLGNTDQMHSTLWRKSKTRWIVTRKSSTSPHADDAQA